MKLNDKKLEELINSLRESLLKQKAILSEAGFDVSQHWREMVNSLEKEKKENDILKE